MNGKKVVTGRKKIVTGRKKVVIGGKKVVMGRKKVVIDGKKVVMNGKKVVTGRKKIVTGRKKVVMGRKKIVVIPMGHRNIPSFVTNRKALSGGNICMTIWCSLINVLPYISTFIWRAFQPQGPRVN